MGLITYENLEDGTPVTANVFNERFAQIIAQLNGNLDESNFADEGISKEKLQAEVYESLYPVGSMYVNFTDDTDPATLLGFGVWTAVAGRFVVGYDGTQTEFNASEKTGGSKTHTHDLVMPNGYDSNKAYPLSGSSFDTLVTANGGSIPSKAISSRQRHATTEALGTANVEVWTQRSKAGDSLAPYIVGYVWKRTS